jgi:hypothetical protein
MIFGGKFPIMYPFHEIWLAYIKLQVKPVLKLKKILFNIECYGRLFSDITPVHLGVNVETVVNDWIIRVTLILPHWVT